MIALPDHLEPPTTSPSALAIGANATPVAPASDAADAERLGDEIARLAAHIHAATYRLLVLIREFDQKEGWAGGFRSCAHWLSWRTGIAPGPARERVRVANALAQLPLISAGMASGELSFSKVRAVTRKATPENEAALLDVARHATAVQTERLVQLWGRVDRLEEAEEEERRHQNRFLLLNTDDDGSFRIRGCLDPEVGALLEKALEWASAELYGMEGEGKEEDEEPKATFGQRQADALGLVAERAMAPTRAEVETEEARRHQRPPLNRADRFQVVVHVDAAELGEDVPAGTSGGKCDCGTPVFKGTRGNVPAHIETRRTALPFAPETARRLACDAGVVLMTHGEEEGVLDVGRKRRTIPPAIRRALEYRDGGCRFPGCDCRYADAHHIVHWADGGETKLDNLILLCRRHHRAVHEEGFSVKVVRGEGERGRRGRRGGRGITYRFLGPDGRVIPEAPAPSPIPADPVNDLVRRHSGVGIEPDEWTATPQWHSEVLDYGLAIDMFRETFPRERPGVGGHKG